MPIQQTSRWSGLAAIGGGLLCAVYGSLLALRRPGVPGNYRDSGDLMPWIMAGLVLIVVGLVGLYFRQARRARGLGRTALVLAIVGMPFMAVGGLAMTRDGTVAGISGFTLFLPGYLAIIVSLLLFGIASLRTPALPLWAGVLLILTPVLLFLFNTEDARAWLMVPFGAAWVVLGYVIRSSADDERLPRGEA